MQLPHTLSEVTGPVFDSSMVDVKACDLARQNKDAPLGERIIVSGRVLDENGRPLSHTLIEVWQANAAGRYRHNIDQHNAPLDPNFEGSGHTLTDEHGHFRFITIRPGSYPWRNHYNAWRPAHIHFSVFGPAFATRLITQMYFPGDPLLPFDPIFNCTTDEKARNRLTSSFDWEPPCVSTRWASDSTSWSACGTPRPGKINELPGHNFADRRPLFSDWPGQILCRRPDRRWRDW